MVEDGRCWHATSSHVNVDTGFEFRGEALLAEPECGEFIVEDILEEGVVADDPNKVDATDRVWLSFVQAVKERSNMSKCHADAGAADDEQDAVPILKLVWSSVGSFHNHPY